MSKLVLLTGAGGSIACHVIAHFMENTDWKMVLVDSFRNDHKGCFDRITTVCADHKDWLPRLKIVRHDLCSQFSSRQIKDIGQVNYILNLASRSDVHNSIEDPIPFVRNNVELMLTMLEYARAIQPEVFLQFSSDEAYGSARRSSKGHREWDAILPSNPYSSSKAMQEALGISWWRSFGVPLILVNSMNHFGQMQSPSKFPVIVQRKIHRDEVIKIHASKDGEIGSRYYLHSRSGADALAFILRNVPPVLHQPGEIDRPVRLNIVGDRQVTNLELVNLIADIMAKTPKWELAHFHDDNPGHDLHYGLNGEALAQLGWKSPVSFEESLRRTVEWQQQHPEWLEP